MNKRNKKNTVLQLSRVLIQIMFFILLPSLYIQTLNGIKQIYLAVINQSFGSTLLPQLIEVIAIIPITILLGRFFCGWMCGFGSFTDFIYLISRKVFKNKFKVNKQVDKLLKYIKYVVLIVLIVAVWNLNITILNTASPWDVFGMLVTIGRMPDFSYVIANLLIGFIIFIGILMGSALIERFFCRYLCPMGAVFAIVSKLRIGKIVKPRDKCGNCRICTNNCAMGIPLYETDVINSAECINCMKCVTACPRGNASYAIASNDVRPLLVSAVSVAVILGSYYSVDLAVNAAGNNFTTISQTTDQLTSVNKLYNDGTYEGTGTGFRRATTTVSVTIKNDKITNISTVSYGDDKPFYDRAYTNVSQEIISDQSSDVDAVSGATFSSNGIMEAVADALSQAKIDEVSSVETATSTPTQDIVNVTPIPEETFTASSNTIATVTQTPTPIATVTETPVTEAKVTETPVIGTSTPEKIVTKAVVKEATITKTPVITTPVTTAPVPKATATVAPTAEITPTTALGQYKDGTYQGSGTGFRRGTTTVTVEVSGGKITNISVDSYQDDRPYFSRAFPTVSENIISSQSTQVDGVSGATFSSNGIMEAVADALSTATN